MTPEEIDEKMREALALPGWYGLFRVPGGYRRTPVLEITVGATDHDSGLTDIDVTFSPASKPEIADVLGRVTCLGVYHDELQPEPDA
jgi:hypothetical protein